MDRQEEKSIVSNCQHGDRTAMDTLVRKLQKPVYNAAYRMLGNADDAADVTQTTFLKVFENIKQFNPRYRLFSWTYRIAMNESIDQLKRRSRSETLDKTPESKEKQPPENVASRQIGDEVQATLLELSEDHRAVMVLRYFGDRSYGEIAQILEIPEKTVKSRLYSARQQMRHRLREHGVFSS